MKPYMGSKVSNETTKIAVVTHYISTTNECIDLPYFAKICSDMY